MTNYIVIIVLAVIVGLAAGYVYREKKKGRKCIGCPDGGSCSCQSGCSGCSCHDKA